MKKIKLPSRKFLIILILIIIAGVLFYLLHGNSFGRGAIRPIQRSIRSFGVWSPLIVIGMIILTTLVPPLPLPLPIIEIAAGIVFGFWEGFLICWLGLIFSSLLAFLISRHFGKRFLRKFYERKIFDKYRNYLNEKGSFAIFIVRLFFINPFNIVSFLAGLTSITTFKFLIATIFGSITESIVFVFIGSQIRRLRFGLPYLGAVLLLVSLAGIIGIIIFLRRKK